jgi:3-deoxy-D-manno-octulosonic acid (KDO) 8-phosphate synthase
MNEISQETISKQLVRITEILEDTFSFQASMAQINRKRVRAMVGVAMKRVTRISKHAKPQNHGLQNVTK